MKMLFKGALALVAVLGFTGLPTAAPAQTIDPVVEDHIADVAQGYQRLSGDTESPCSVACQDIVRDEQRRPTAPEDPVDPRLTRSFIDGPIAPDTKAPWKKPLSFIVGRGLPVAGLVVANLYVWKVGVYDQLHKYFYVAAPKAAVDDGWSFIFTISDPSLYPQGGASPTLPDPLPVGLVATGDHGTVMSTTGGNGDYPRDCFGWGPSIPAGLEAFTWTWNSCIGAAMVATGWKVPLNQAMRMNLDFDPAQDPPPVISTPGQRLTLEEAIARLRALLSSGDADYDTLEQWFCSVLGGECRNPKDVYPTVPQCAGLTVEACRQAFRDVGFVGQITTEPLNADTAVMEIGAGKTTGTSPRAGESAAANTDVVMFENPDPLPTMSDEENAIADTLAANNPATVSETNKRTIARTCVRDMQIMPGGSAGQCTALPIMVAGNDQETPARNALQGLIRNPSWLVLNARVGPSRTGWYDNLGEPAPGCLKADREPATATCDEFPFWSTLQAHGGTLETITPSIRWAPEAEQNRQSAVIKQFYSNNAPGPSVPFPGCDVTKQQPTDPIGLPESAYIVLPLPFSSLIASTSICNKPTKP